MVVAMVVVVTVAILTMVAMSVMMMMVAVALVVVMMVALMTVMMMVTMMAVVALVTVMMMAMVVLVMVMMVALVTVMMVALVMVIMMAMLALVTVTMMVMVVLVMVMMVVRVILMMMAMVVLVMVMMMALVMVMMVVLVVVMVSLVMVVVMVTVMMMLALVMVTVMMMVLALVMVTVMMLAMLALVMVTVMMLAMLALVMVTVMMMMLALVMVTVMMLAMLALVMVTVMMLAMLALVMVTVMMMLALVMVTVMMVLALVTLSLDPRSVRSCTWPRARTPRTPRPEPGPGPAPAHPAAGPVSGRSPAVPPPDDAISLRLGAGAMARWAQAEADGWRRLLRAVTRLQACVRGYLVRKRFQSLRAAFEEVVLELEGDLSQLRWRGRLLPRPVFIPEEPAQGKCSGPNEAAPSDRASTEEPQEELDASEPEQDRGCSSLNPTAQLLSEKGLSPTGAGDAVTPLTVEADADEHPEKGCSAPAGSKDLQNNSNVACGLEAESLGARLEIPLVDIKELPRTRSGLQSYRNHLVMELLWLEQAIVSRKNFLTLKQRLGAPGGGQS